MLRSSGLEERGRSVLFVAGAILLAGLVSVSRAWPSQGQVLIESSQQLFAVLAALNDAGYDTGITKDAGDRTRAAVRAALQAEQISVLPEIKKFYEAHRIANSGANLAQYVSLALLLGPPPDFKFTVAQADLPPDARAVSGLVPLLKVFYKQADLADLWARAEINYQSEINRYSPLVRQSLRASDAYLRFPSGAYLGRTYTIDLALLGAPNQVQARIYGSNYYLVITPSREPKIAEIRYQYLHFLLDPLALKYPDEIRHAAVLAGVARKAPALSKDFKEDFPLLLTECLIKAVELHMDHLPLPQAKKRVQELMDSGLILVPYFDEALRSFEQQGASMEVYYKQMVQKINPSVEGLRLEHVHFTKPSPRVAEAPERSELEQLLDEGDNDIYAGKYREAKKVFQEALAKNPRSGRALFGMGVSEGNTRKPDFARKYFEQALATARDLRLVTWSHIYLGRLDDIEGNRKQALAQYRAAALTAAAYPEALRAVQTGLKEPFGVEFGSKQ